MSLLLSQIYCLTLFLLGYIAVLEKDMNPKQSEKDLIDNLKSEIKIMISASQIGSVVEASNSLYSREGTIYNDSLTHF